jgi:hypothetical protein
MALDPYPTFSDAHKAWFVALLEGMVKDPKGLDVMRIKGGNDLELAIVPAAADEQVFTEEVCLALKTLVAATTGVFSPVIYVHGKPHPRAEESRQAAMSSI